MALPQYKRAVEKSRHAAVLSLFKSVASAVDAYQMSQGTFPDSLEILDVGLPNDWTGIATRKYSPDNKWYLDLTPANENGWRCLNMLKGDGTPNGFSICWASDGRAFPLRELLCREYFSTTPAGSFCEKLYHGSMTTNAGSARFYTMPDL